MAEVRLEAADASGTASMSEMTVLIEVRPGSRGPTPWVTSVFSQMRKLSIRRASLAMPCKLLIGERAKDEVGGKPQRHREWIADHRPTENQHDRAPLKKRPWCIRVRRDHDAAEEQREEYLDGDKIQQVRPDEIVALAAPEA